MKQRYLLVTIDTISEILKDYIANEQDLPADATPIAMQVHPTSKKLAITFASPSLKENSLPLNVNFDIKRVYSV